ncbi:MAG: hypothetical protein LBS98_08030, partial [Coriobacteriales bacterium]|nr:hypothetical protein [Coriobacteriales bacterium]
MPNSKGSGSQRVGASGSSHVLRAERLKQRRSSGVLSKLLSVVLAINMALMFALPATIFADNPSNNAADDYVTAPSANDVLSEDPGSSGSTVGDATGQEVTIEQPSVSGDAAVSPTNDAASVTTLDGDESLDGGFGVLDVGDVDVSDWAGFLAAWRDPATVRILLTNDITHPGGTTAGNRLSNGFTRTTDIQVTSAAGGPFTIDFGADANAANSFVLGTATAATPHRFNLNNVIIAHAGAAYTNAVVYSGTTAVNAAGWTVAIGNVSSKADTAPSILAVQINRGFNVELSGTIKWKSTSPQYDVYARNITIANGSTLDLASGAAANIYPLGALEMVMVGSNVNLTLSGTAGINSSGIVAIANNTKVTFSTTTGGILASSFAVGAGSKLTFEAGTAAAGGIIAPSGIAIGPLTEVSIATGTLTSNGGAIVISDGATVTIDNGSIVSTSTSSSFTTGNYVTLSLTNPTGNGITLPTTGVPNTVTFGERNTVNITCLNYAVSARGLTIGKDTVANFSTSTTVSSATATINLRPQNADAARPAFLNILDGADVTVTANAANGIWLDSTVNKGEQTNSTSMTGARSDILVVNGAKLTVTGNGTGNGYRGAVCMLGVGGGITATNGSTISITATNAAAYPAALLQMRDGQFNVSGASTLAIKQLGSQDGYTATLRFRYGNGQSFNVSGGSTVTIERPAYTRGDSYKSAAIRFGDATGNSFNIIEGSKVKVYNGGTGTADTASGEPGGNEAIEIVNNDFSFTLSGAGSSCELVADLGAAVDANAHSGASITVGPGTAFLATGNTGNTTFAIFQCTGGNFNFTTTNPLYYDFQNTRAGGGRILGIGTSTTSTFKSTNSDVALWRGGVNAASGNPGASFTYISYALSGSALATVSADSDAAFRAYYLGGGTSAWYTRISGNNGLPEIPTTGAVVPTNADKYVRVLGTLAEGSQPARPFWDNEVWGEFEYTPLGGSPILYQSTNTNRNTVRSFNSEPVYLQETAANLPGVLRLDNNNNFLKPGDGYRLLRAWRSDNPDDTNRHESVYQLPISVVQDVTPPKPADIDFPQSGSFFYIGQNTISGTYPLAAAQDAWNAEPAVSGKLLLVNTANPAGVEITGSTVTLNPSGTWTATVPSTATLADGDKIHIVLSDTNGNT